MFLAHKLLELYSFVTSHGTSIHYSLIVTNQTQLLPHDLMTNARFPPVHILFRNEVLTELQLYTMDPSGLADQTCFVNNEVPYSKVHAGTAVLLGHLTGILHCRHDLSRRVYSAVLSYCTNDRPYRALRGNIP